MPILTRETTINAPLEKVWAFWADVEKTPEWVSGVTSSKITGPEREGKGMTWSEKGEFGSQKIDMEHEVLHWEPAKKTIVHTALPMGAKIERITEFATVGDTTEVKAVLDWDFGIVVSLLGEEKVAATLESSLERTLENWKQQLES